MHSTRSRKGYKLPVACPGAVILSNTKTGRHDIAESGGKHQNSNSGKDLNMHKCNFNIYSKLFSVNGQNIICDIHN
jgi:hypothetical protein